MECGSVDEIAESSPINGYHMWNNRSALKFSAAIVDGKDPGRQRVLYIANVVLPNLGSEPITLSEQANMNKIFIPSIYSLFC